jgi:hypothetical protein
VVVKEKKKTWVVVCVGKEGSRNIVVVADKAGTVKAIQTNGITSFQPGKVVSIRIEDRPDCPPFKTLSKLKAGYAQSFLETTPEETPEPRSSKRARGETPSKRTRSHTHDSEPSTVSDDETPPAHKLTKANKKVPAKKGVGATSKKGPKATEEGKGTGSFRLINLNPFRP